VAALPPPPTAGRGATPAARPPSPARGRQTVIAWTVARRIGTLAVGDPRGVLHLDAGRRHNQRTRDWRIGHLITVLKDKAEAAGIGLQLVDERGTSSTCPACRSRIPKPPGRVLACPACQYTGHRDLVAAANIAARAGGGTTPAIPAGVTHRRAHHRGAHGSPGRHRPARASPPKLARESLATPVRSLNTARNYRQVH
jgi:putative transposase